MYTVSFDVANKSLAVSIIYYNEKYNKNISDLYDDFLHKKNYIKSNINNDSTTEICNAIIKILQLYKELIIEYTKLSNNRMRIEYADVFDLLPNKKVNQTETIYRTECLLK